MTWVHADTHKIVGKVVDKSGQPLVHVEISYRNPFGNTAVMSDEKGRFSVQDLRGSSLTFSSPGYSTKNVTIEKLTATNQIVTLFKVQPNIEEIVVRSESMSRPFAPIYMNVIETLVNPASRGDALTSVGLMRFSTSTGESAHVQLRGSSAVASRVYLGDVPLYEAIRGVDLSTTAPGTSLLGPNLFSEMEVYPSNPPIYLSNAGSNAVRLLPFQSEETTSTLALMSVGISGNYAVPLKSDFLTTNIFGEKSHSSFMLKLNPSLESTLHESRGGKYGATFSFDTNNMGRFQAIVMNDQSDGIYPINAFSEDINLELDQRQSLKIVSYETLINEALLKIKTGISKSSSQLELDQRFIENQNTYEYRGIDISSGFFNQQGSYRLGIDEQNIFLSSNSIVEQDRESEYNKDLYHGSSKSTATIQSAFGYVVFDIGDRISMQAGFKSTYEDWLLVDNSRQLGLVYYGKNNNWNLNCGYGKYFTHDVPFPGMNPIIELRETKQSACDYVYNGEEIQTSFGVYTKDENLHTKQYQIQGLDLSTSWHVSKNVSVRFSFTRAESIVDEYKIRYTDEHSLDYLTRFDINYQFTPTKQVSLHAITRSGQYFTPIGDQSPRMYQNESNDLIMNIYTDQFDRYERLDMSFTSIVNIYKDFSPILFLSINNLTNKKNTRSKGYLNNYSTSYDLYYPGRSFTFGFILVFR